MSGHSAEKGRGVATLRKPGTVLGYYGSKTRAAARIVELMPEHDAYVEPFCGSLAVLRFAAVAERLAHVSLECRPALDIIERYGRDATTLLYVDPPYLGTTRSRTAYRHEMHKAEEHRDLARGLQECKAVVVLSGYHSPLYDELYAGWHRAEISAFTGQANGGRDAGARTEVLWSNRPIGEGMFTTPLTPGATT